MPRTALWSLLALLLLTGCETTPPSPQLTVLSFNIRYNNPNDGPHAWPNRADRVAGLIQFHQADVIGVQEALHSQMMDLEERLEGFAWTGVGRDDGQEAGEYSAIFYRTARLELEATDTFWLSETPDEVGSVGWDAAITRVVTWARFKDLESGETFYHFNTHFDHRGQQARLESARLLVKQIPAIAGDEPAIITGDFNFTEEAEGYDVLTQSLSDAYYASTTPAYSAPSTIYGGFEVTHQPGRRIDYIFTRGNLPVARFGVLSDNWDGAFPSDHLPVLADIQLR